VKNRWLNVVVGATLVVTATMADAAPRAQHLGVAEAQISLKGVAGRQVTWTVRIEQNRLTPDARRVTIGTRECSHSTCRDTGVLSADVGEDALDIADDLSSATLRTTVYNMPLTIVWAPDAAETADGRAQFFAPISGGNVRVVVERRREGPVKVSLGRVGCSSTGRVLDESSVDGRQPIVTRPLPTSSRELLKWLGRLSACR
jgi:hypothetical protein